MNKIDIIGRLVRDIELSTTSSGLSICKFSIAVKDNYNKEKTDFFNCTAFRERAEIFAKYVKKGDLVGLSGSMHQVSFTKKDGTQFKDWDLQVDNVYLLEKPKTESKEVKTEVEKPKKEIAEDNSCVNAYASLEETDTDDDFPF